MNLSVKYIRLSLFASLFMPGSVSHSQITANPVITLDTTFFSTITTGIFQPAFNYIDHSPDKQDKERYTKYKSLITQKPSSKNHELYFSLACSLWELEKQADAEKMFLAIVNSKESFYEATYYHSSDIPGDTTQNSYGYGSFTSNYKNNAAVYLTKIYLEQNKITKALQYLDDAVKKYKVTYSCGTGYRGQQDEYEFLYASCYAGLNKHKEVLNLLFPACLERNDDLIIASIQKTYSPAEIQEYLQKAENSIECLIDSFPSFSYQISNYGTDKEKTDTVTYISGTGSILLFDRKISMPVPRLKNGEQLTRDMLVNIFKSSIFYRKLKSGD